MNAKFFLLHEDEFLVAIYVVGVYFQEAIMFPRIQDHLLFGMIDFVLRPDQRLDMQRLL